MSVQQTNTVDSIGIDKKTGIVILTISDHLGWTNIEDHLLLLQEKINTYISFIESGEIYETYPSATDKPLRIDILFKNEIPEEATNFIKNIEPILENIGIKLHHEVFKN